MKNVIFTVFTTILELLKSPWAPVVVHLAIEVVIAILKFTKNL
ncbi:MAG: hypothetical protein ABSG63_07145 [Spirochaetia bacterium]|jgi:hypothetical protein